MSELSAFKKIKWRHMPGDISRGHKLILREQLDPNEAARSKAFNREIRLRAKAVLKERTKREIARQLDD